MLAVLGAATPAQAAEGPPWQCGSNAPGLLYQSSSSARTTVNQIDLIIGSDREPVNVEGANINATGYNQLDDYVYGWSIAHQELVRVAGDGTMERLGRPTGVPNNIFIGDVDENGFWWAYSGSTWYRVNLETMAVTSGSAPQPTGLGGGLDWAFVPGTDTLWRVAFDTRTDVAVLTGFDRSSRTWTSPVPLPGRTSGNYGAAFADPDGFLYASHNETGEIVRVDVASGASALFAEGPPSSGNDGARCAGSPILLDFGDAPDSYGTTLASNGPRHGVTDYDSADQTAPLRLGATVDAESDGTPSTGADSDGADDGVGAPIVAIEGRPTTVVVSATNETDDRATLAGWIDLDGDGSFGPDERVSVEVPAGAGTSDYELAFPAATLEADSYARFRLFPGTVDAPAPTGAAAAGEVEDYAVALSPASLELQKNSDATEDTRAGDEVTYTVMARNVGDGDFTEDAPAVVVDDLAGVLDDAEMAGAAVAEVDGVAVTAPTLAGTTLTWRGPLSAGQVLTISYTVTVGSGGDGAVRNVAFQPSCDSAAPGCEPSPPEECVQGADPQTGLPCAEVLTELPRLVLDKSADTTELPADGATVNYLVRVTNTGPGTFTEAAPATVSDDLSAVLDDAAYNDDAAATVGGTPVADPVVDDATLTWSGPLGPGQSVEIRYSVTYDADAPQGDNELVNRACIDEDAAAPGARACDNVQIPGSDLDVTKSVSPESGTSVAAGDQLVYTLVFDNDGPAAASVDWTDHLDGVLDDGAVTSGPVAQDGLTAQLAGAQLDVDGEVPGGEVRLVTYTVTVGPDGERGDNVLANFLAAGDEEPPAQCNPSTGLCTQNPVAEVVSSKSVDPASGTVLEPGDDVTYTLTFENEGQGTGQVAADDDLRHVLDDAELIQDPRSSSDALTVGEIEGTRFSVTGELGALQSATVTYTVRVKAAADRGDSVLGNVLLAPGEAPPAEPGCPEGATACTVNPVQELVDRKAVDPEKGTSVAAGDELTYTLTFENLGGLATPVDRVDDLTHVLDDAVVTREPTASDADALTVSGLADGRYAITGTLEPGQSVTVTYTVTVAADGERGDNILGNVILDPDEETPAVPLCLPQDEDCTVNPIAEIRDSKAVEPSSGTSVVAGQEVTYTLTFENVGTGSGAVDRVDDLTHVLDDAAVTAAPTSSDPALAVSEITAGRYAITGSLAAGQTVTVSYTVQVADAAERGDSILANYLLDPDQEPPAEPVCEAGETDCTVNPVSAVSVVKSSDPASGTQVEAGDGVTYTLTFRNDGTGSGAIDVTDHLGGVLDDADLRRGPALDGAEGLSVTGVAEERFTVSGELAAGAVATVTYGVQVRDHEDQGDHLLGNVVTATGEQPSGPCVEDDPLCTVHPIAEPPLVSLPDTGAGQGVLFGSAGLLMLLTGVALWRRREVAGA